MIEAVNSVVSNAPLVRIAADQVDVARSFASNPSNIQQPAGANLPTAPYLSPFIAWNNDFGKAVLQIRDSESGEVVNQFPSDSRLRAQLGQAIGNELAAPEQPQLSEDAGSDVPAPQAAAPQGAAPQVAEAQVAAAALAKGAQASLPQIATVVTSA